MADSLTLPPSSKVLLTGSAGALAGTVLNTGNAGAFAGAVSFGLHTPARRQRSRWSSGKAGAHTKRFKLHKRPERTFPPKIARELLLALAVVGLGFPGLASAQPISLETAPPVVVKTSPTAGATDVDPALNEIRVSFSKPMQDGSWSWSTWGEENFPQMDGQPRYLPDGRTCVLPVKLEPGKFYATWLNSDKFRNFKDREGRPAVPYLLTFTTASTAAAELIPVPQAEDLPGTLIFQGRYQHRSRGSAIETPSELWLTQTAAGGLHALARLPWMGTRELATGDGANRLNSYRIVREAAGNQPGYRIDLELADGSARLTRRGIRQNVDDKELVVPPGAQFDPNTRPDAYCAANLLLRAFAVAPGATNEFRVFDWDNSGEGLVDYIIQVRHAGKETVEVPAGTFEANHLVLQQLTSADTWFKKRAGHITDFWVLDNQVIVRVLRHREPYEMLLLDYTVPQKLGAAGAAVSPETAVQEVARQFAAAIQERDNDRLRALSTDAVVPGWRDAVAHFGDELRVRLNESGVGFGPLGQIEQVLVENDVAAVKTAHLKEKNIYLALFFQRTAGGWRNCGLQNSPAAKSLKQNLREFVERERNR